MMEDSFFQKYARPFGKGEVWIAGAGAGDIGLLTLHVLYGLKNADVILYDALINSECLQFINDQAETIYVGKRHGAHCAPTQEDINQCLVEEAKKGRRVLRLKGGDPLVFARTGEELAYLAKRNVPIRIIPGVSSVTAALSYAGIMLTHRAINASVLLLTGHDKTGDLPSQLDWHSIVHASPVLVFFMALSKLKRISDVLIDHGRDPDEPAAVISHATYPQQKIVTAPLKDLASQTEKARLTPPALVIIGEVVRHHYSVIPANPDGAEEKIFHHLQAHLPSRNSHFLLLDGEKIPYPETN